MTSLSWRKTRTRSARSAAEPTRQIGQIGQQLGARFADDLVVSWTRHVNDHGGAVTWDLPLTADGIIADAYMKQLRALQAEKLILLTDVEGVKDTGGQLIGQLSEPEVEKLVAEGTIAGGMIPKVECCLDALRGGVRRAHIVDGRILHAILLEIFTDGGVGTLLTR